MMSNNEISSLHKHPAYLQLHKSFQQTKTHLSITDLNLTHPLIQKSPHIFPLFLQRNAKKLRSIPPQLKRLTLDIYFSDANPLPLYNHLLKDLRHIEHLKITLYPNYGHHVPSYFDILLKTLKKARNLQVFEVIVPKSFQWRDDNSMQSLIRTLSKSASMLKDVKILFGGSYGGSLAWATSKSLLDEWRIQKLAIVQSLTLHLPREAFVALNTTTEGKFRLSGFKRFRKLKFLELAMQLGPDCKSFVFEPPKTQLFPNLKRFQWSLLGCSWTEIQGLKLDRDFDRIIKIQEKFFKPRWAEVEGLHLLGSELARSLGVPPEDFILKFKQNGTISSSDIKTLSQSFTSLTTGLNQLHLDCSKLNQKASENLLCFLSGPKLRRMQVLCLESLDGEGINDMFLIKLGEAFSYELRYLRLSFKFVKQEDLKEDAGFLQSCFGGEKGITDKGTSKFGEIMAEKCKKLEFVWLEFEKYEKISDKGVESLCEGLKKIESLKRVWLKFERCGEVSGKFSKEILNGKGEVKFALI